MNIYKRFMIIILIIIIFSLNLTACNSVIDKPDDIRVEIWEDGKYIYETIIKPKNLSEIKEIQSYEEFGVSLLTYKYFDNGLFSNKEQLYIENFVKNNLKLDNLTQSENEFIMKLGSIEISFNILSSTICNFNKNQLTFKNSSEEFLKVKKSLEECKNHIEIINSYFSN